MYNNALNILHPNKIWLKVMIHNSVSKFSNDSANDRVGRPIQTSN